MSADSTLRMCPGCGGVLAPDDSCWTCAARALLPEAPVAEGSGVLPLTLGDYLLEEEIARGGMGIVYRAWQLSLDRVVAVKVMREGLFAGGQEVARFRQEASAAAALRHPGLVPVIESGECEGRLFYAMEWISGPNLAEVTREHPASAKQAAQWVRDVALAMQHAHDHGVVHRDLKPANVLLDDGGRTRVTDFGMAQRADTASGLTLSGQMLGTPGYMAPEMASGGATRTVGVAVDVYGLGAILYHLLTGRPPFVGNDPMAVLRQVESGDPPSLRLLNPEIPIELEAVALKCLAREPERRYARAAEVADEMQRWLDGRPVLAKPAGRIRRASRWVRRNRGPTSAAAAIFLLLASIAVISVIAARRLEKSRDAEANGRKELRRTLYATGLRVAQQLYDEGALGNVADWVAAQVPPPGEEDLRTFEWRLLRAWARGEQDSVVKLSPPAEAGALSPCGRFATSFAAERIVLHDLRTGLDAGSWKEPPGAFGDRRRLTATPDGRKIIATSVGGMRLWDAAAGEVRVLETWPVEAAAFSPDGRLLAVSAFPVNAATSAGGVVFYDATTWQKVAGIPGRVCGFTWQGATFLLLNFASGRLEWWSPGAAQAERSLPLSPQPRVWATPCFSSDGRRVAVQSDNEHLAVFDTGTGAVVAEFASVFSPITLPLLSSDGRWLARGGTEEEIQLYDLEKPAAPPRRLRGHRARMLSLRFTGDDRQIVSWSADGTLRTWSVESAARRPIVDIKWAAAAAVPPVFSPDGRWVACANDFDGSHFAAPAHTVIWDRVAGRKMAGCAVLPLAATVDGRALIGLRAGQFIVWEDAATGAEIRAVALPEVVRTRVPRVSPDGRYVAFWIESNRGAIHDLTTGQRAFEMAEGTTAAQFSPDGKSVAMLTTGIGLRVIDLATWAERPPIPPTMPLELVWSRDCRRIAFVYRSNTPMLAIADVATMTIEGTLTGQGLPNMLLAFSPDGRTLVSNTRDGTLRFWNLLTWSRSLVLPPEGQIRSLVFTPDGEALMLSRGRGWRQIDAPFTFPAAPGQRP